MTNARPVRASALGACLLSALLLTACASLVTPNVQATAERLRAGDYELDPAHAVLLFKIDHLGFSKYVGRFNTFDAALSFNADDPASAELEAVIQTASIDVGDPDFAKTLAGPDWFDSETFPEAMFRSVAVEVTGDASARIEGELTLLGVTKPVSLEATFNGGARNLLTQRYTLGFEAHGVFNRSDFGMDRLLPAVGDAVELEIHAEFLRR
ncbi:MAG: YceI family protein [Pseudomonadota bacterium]